MHRFIKTRYTSFNRMLGHVLPPRTLNGSANVLPSGPKDHLKLFACIRTRKGKNILNFSLSLSSFFRAPLSDCPKSGSRSYHLLLQHGRTQGAKSCHRASARTLCRSGSMPSLSSAAGGGFKQRSGIRSLRGGRQQALMGGQLRDRTFHRPRCHLQQAGSGVPRRAPGMCRGA